MFEKLKSMFSTEARDAEMEKRLEELRAKTPVPVFWLYGKTQSGKTSIIKFLTGADEAEIGEGFKPCTQFSRQYEFPTAEAPLLTFLDTRGVDEPGYDPKVDLDQFNDQAHVVVVTVKVMDHAVENTVKHLRTIRRSKPDRPVVLVLTCLHEAYPQQQHPQPYEGIRWQQTGETNGEDSVPIPDALRDSINEQLRRFAGLYDVLVPIDLTRVEEGYDEPNYGGQRLKEVLLESLPRAYRQTLITLDQATGELQDLYARHAIPHILGYSSMAATAGAIPIPGVDLLIVPGIQTRMIYHLAQFYGQPLTGNRFLEMASTLGMGMLVRQVTRQVFKFIPVVGSMIGAGIAFASTFALGKAFCYYYSSVHRGQVPRAEDLRKYYKEQLALAEETWRKKKESEPQKTQ
jgi:uncharacterized protein (DUF697 family)/predicted GTPase